VRPWEIAVTESYDVNNQRTTLDSGLRYAETRGWKVYPLHGVSDDGVCRCAKGERCPHPGKHPATPHGVNDASSDPAEVANMFARWGSSECGVGLATGVRSGAAVLDVDGYDGGWSSVAHLEESHGRLPPTLLHHTGSGDVHHVYAVPDHLERLPSRTIAPGIELKADGTGVVLPPSRSSWGEYAVLIDRPLAPLPEWIVEMATRPAAAPGGDEGSTESRFALPDAIREGVRAWTLYRLGCSLRAHGWDYGAILEELRRVNADLCVPPLGDDEVEGRARSAVRHEKGNASTPVSPEVLGTLDAIQEHVLDTVWRDVGGKSERSVMVALILAARRHGTLILAGVRISLGDRTLAEMAGMGKSSANRAAHRLRQKGWLRFDNEGRREAHSGAFVLVCAPTPRKVGHSTTSPSLVEREEGWKSVPACAPLGGPRLRWGFSLGKGCEEVIDALQRAGGEMGLEELAKTVGASRLRDFRRRALKRLVEAQVVEAQQVEDGGETVRLTENWVGALDRERTLTGEKRAENLDRAGHERQREAYRMWLSEKREETT